jgi:hypothetical protein
MIHGSNATGLVEISGLNGQDELFVSNIFFFREV